MTMAGVGVLIRPANTWEGVSRASQQSQGRSGARWSNQQTAEIVEKAMRSLPTPTPGG